MRYELIYTGRNRVRGMIKGNNPDALISKVMQDNPDEWELFRADSGFHSTTQDEYLIYWYSRNNNSYYANRSKSEPELLQKQYKGGDSTPQQESKKFSMARVAKGVINEVSNQQVIKMFVTDRFPHSPDEMADYGFGSNSRWKPQWGANNLKISQAPNGWVLLNYTTPLLFRDDQGRVFFDASKYSVSTSKIQTYIRGELAKSGVKFDMVDPKEMAKLSGIKTGMNASAIAEYDGMERDTDMVSDIAQTWQDPIEISQDIREFLMSMQQEGVEDYQLEDVIDAIENGIKEFRKIVGV